MFYDESSGSAAYSASSAVGGVGGSVPATLSLTLGAPAAFGNFTPGVTRTYEASTTAGVISTARNTANTGTAYNNVGSSAAR